MSDAILARCAAGDISPQIALAQLLLTGTPPDPATLARAAEGGSPGLHALAALAERHRDRLAPLAALARRGFTPGGADPIADTAAMFDRLAAEAPEAAVAFYSLGDTGELDRATAELLAVIDAWVPVAGLDLIDWGCGIGRVAVPLAERARSVLALDVSPGMAAEAARRGAGLPGLAVETTGGRDLAGVADLAADAVLAIDSLPFLYAAGPDAVDAMAGEIARVLRPGGALVVFNWSYRGDEAADRADAAALGARYGFAVERAGERPFAIWDGTGYLLRRTA